ncbi:MAG TPA: UDP-N-acetylmuramoyl-tripeptide--D-alanyl-D-alanine ligase [Polyangia bacterium]|nr:UDP-N-acetylmuramoyl-tripeptide--D-alanyl-D-alanine ligase [Polyangia bacterium]
MSAARRTLDFAVAAMRGQVLQAAARPTFAGAAADSRAVAAEQLFFALPGERVDGFDFAAQAAAAGAAGVVVAAGRGLPAGCAGATVIAVDDPRRALGDLARAARAEFRGRVVAVTGSNGKTTTKELCAAALRPLGEVLRTPGNFNTDVGLPLTILSASGAEAAWVLEMAMRAPGEIAYLTEIARPGIGIITNVAAAHLETLGSIEGVARAKGELFAGLGPTARAVLPVDDPLIAAQAAPVAPERRLTFGGRAAGDVRLLDFVPAGAGGAVVRYAVRGTPVVARLPLGGAHNARNGAAALAAAFAAGVAPVDAARGLESVALPPHRSAPVAAGGRTILDDCYNANPASMSAALAALGAAAGSGRRFAILGDMLELGPGAEAAHRALGRAAGGALGGLAAVGALAPLVVEEARAAGLPPGRAVVAASPEAAAAAVGPWTAPGDWILVKASRGLRLERAVEALRAALDPPREK